MSVAILTPETREACDVFIRGHPDALFCQSLPFVEFVAEVLQVRNQSRIVLSDDGAVTGFLPILEKSGPLGRVLNSLPFFGSHGGALAATPTSHASLVAEFNRLANELDVTSAVLIDNPFVPGDYRSLCAPVVDRRIGQFTLLGPDDAQPARLLDRLHGKTRNLIRKAEKCGIAVTVENTDGLTFLAETHRENLAALGGQAKPDSFFSLLGSHFTADLDYRLYTARVDANPVAALLVFYFGKFAEYFMPAVKAEFRASQPVSLLAYRAMIDAAARGVRIWNWGGTWGSQHGVYHFKSRWDTCERNYDYHVQLNQPELASLQPREILAAYPYFYVLPFTSLPASTATPCPD